MTEEGCSAFITYSSWPWLLFLLVGAYLFSQREKRHAQKIIDLQVTHNADMENLLRLRDEQMTALQASYERELTVIREAKNLVWIHVTDGKEKQLKN